MNNQVWNQFLIRFFLAFAFWEAIGFPVKLLLFSKFYYNMDLSGLFVPMIEVYWAGPVFADFIMIFVIGALYSLAKNSLPAGVSGGVIFGLLLSFMFAGISLFMISFTNSMTAVIWWVWDLHQLVLSLFVSVIYSTSTDK